MRCCSCGKEITEGHPFLVIINENYIYCDMACENTEEFAELNS